MESQVVKKPNVFLGVLKGLGITLAVVYSLAFIASVIIAIIVYVRIRKMLQQFSLDMPSVAKNLL
jgi:isoprenylcysteine carboxyl methyltransferase (ICMT) family protein YpbQ